MVSTLKRHPLSYLATPKLPVRPAASYISDTEASTGSGLPHFVKDDFDAFLECRLLAHGFLRAVKFPVPLRFIQDNRVDT